MDLTASHPRGGTDRRKGFTEADYAQLLDAAHQQLAARSYSSGTTWAPAPSGVMAELIAARDWLAAYTFSGTTASALTRR